MKILADINHDFYKVSWLLSAGDLILQTQEKTVRVLDSDIKKRSIGGFCVDGLIIGVPDQEIKVPDYVLNKRDQIRKWRLKKQAEDRNIKLGDIFLDKGVITFFSCFGLLVAEFEEKAETIADDSIKTIDGKHFVNGDALFPDKGIHQIEIPDEVLEKRDEKRAEYSLQKQFTYIMSTNDENSIIEYYIRNNGELLLKCSGKEAIVTEIENLYRKRVVKVESLQLTHPYIEIPEKVETAFMDMQKKLGFLNLQLLPVGVSLLDGKLYYALSNAVPSDDWNKISSFFIDFGTDSDLKGMLTCDPDRVASALGIEFNKIEA
jgi:hypothetical protein